MEYVFWVGEKLMVLTLDGWVSADLRLTVPAGWGGWWDWGEGWLLVGWGLLLADGWEETRESGAGGLGVFLV